MARDTRNVYDYVADDHGSAFPGYVFGMEIKDSEAAEASRGWVLADGARTTPPQRFKPRHVVGRDSAGHTGRAICAIAGSDLWLGVATTFAVNGVTYTVTGYVGERRSIRAPKA